MTAPVAAAVVARLTAGGLTVATAESLTGGLVTAALTAVPGASAVVRGGVVAYATEVKAGVLGVDGSLLAAGGPVQAEVARQLARSAAGVMAADCAVATTGVAGPGQADGHEAGTVFVAACLDDRVAVRRLQLAGTRALVRRATVDSALALLLGLLIDREHSPAGRS
ncbi:nicotinamide-nucleotide amidohydrolase family protein [Georgenia sp. MJ173]|uniref:CinA family protein n=1 Tax=Georgenia sunbinii TaxID=3117728 RepID=UPI002F261E46